MITFTRVPREDMERRHAEAARARRSQPMEQAQRARNLLAVLDLGNRIYFTFRGRAYGVPPLPWKAGAAVHAIWTEAQQYPTPLTADTLPRYYATLHKLPPLLWAHCRPVGPLLRLCRRLGLLRNPFEAATETELVQLADFFLRCRMRSTVRYRSPGMEGREATPVPTS